jgi:hypothetical protein
LLKHDADIAISMMWTVSLSVVTLTHWMPVVVMLWQTEPSTRSG